MCFSYVFSKNTHQKWLQEGLEPHRLAIHRTAKVEYVGKYPMNSY